MHFIFRQPIGCFLILLFIYFLPDCCSRAFQFWVKHEMKAGIPPIPPPTFLFLLLLFICSHVHTLFGSFLPPHTFLKGKFSVFRH
jgi:hypothetical protein